MIFCPLKLNLRQIQGFPSSNIKMHINLQTHERTRKTLHTRTETHTHLNKHSHTHTHKCIFCSVWKHERLLMYSFRSSWFCCRQLVRLTWVSGLRALSGSPHLLCNAKQPQSGITAERRLTSNTSCECCVKSKNMSTLQKHAAPTCAEKFTQHHGKQHRSFFLSFFIVFLVFLLACTLFSHPGVCLSGVLWMKNIT